MDHHDGQCSSIFLVVKFLVLLIDIYVSWHFWVHNSSIPFRPSKFVDSEEETRVLFFVELPELFRLNYFVFLLVINKAQRIEIFKNKYINWSTGFIMFYV